MAIGIQNVGGGSSTIFDREKPGLSSISPYFQPNKVENAIADVTVEGDSCQRIKKDKGEGACEAMFLAWQEVLKLFQAGIFHNADSLSSR